jgi:serine protease
MSRRVAIAAAIAATLVAALFGGAQASAAAGEAAGSSAAASAALIQVATPALPSGESDSARRRWHQLRARSSQVLGRLADRYGLEVRDRVPEIGLLSVELGGASVAGLRLQLAGDPAVERVIADRPVEFRYAPNDFAFSRADLHAPGGDLYQWNLLQSQAPGGWDLSKGAGAEVAVIDSGAYVAHPELSSRVAATLDCIGGCAGTNVSDTDGHGTHVAGLACADSDNTLAIASMGFDCDLFIARIFTCGDANAAVVAAGNRGSDAISMSFGCSPAGVMESALAYAWARGSVPVAAGANNPAPAPSDPSQWVQPEGTGPDLDFARGLVVTAAKHGGARAAFAQANTGVSVAAFGAATDQVSGGEQGILSTFPPALPPTPYEGAGIRTTLNGDNRYAYLVGTSMAAPQVGGLVALMRAAKPGLAASKLVRLLKLSAGHCGEYRDGIGWGLIDARAAVAAALDRDIDSPHSRIKSARRETLRIKRFDRACHTELPSAGIKTVRLFAATGNSEYRKIGKTRKKRFAFKGKAGKRYRFYSVAVDKAGNREPVPERPDEKLRVKR